MILITKCCGVPVDPSNSTSCSCDLSHCETIKYFSIEEIRETADKVKQKLEKLKFPSTHVAFSGIAFLGLLNSLEQETFDKEKESTKNG